MLNRIKSILTKIIEGKEINKLIKTYGQKEKIIYFQTPEHGNLGDQAIAIAGKKIIEDKHNDKLVLEFTYNEYIRNKEKIKNLINENDILYIHGGGNFGNLYKWEESQRRDIIEAFKNNKIISMPQSLSYTNNDEGNKELEITKKIASEHNDLTIIARDEKSYSFAKNNFVKNKVVMAPDSVLYLEDYYLSQIEQDRKGVLFTIRKDVEKVLSDKKIHEIKDILDKNKIVYNVDDTTVPYDVSRKTRDYEVQNILRKISKSELNITDRFHGVIFSVITNTPVIVFKSLDHKIAEGIKWFKHLDYVHYVTEDDDIEEIIKKYVGKNYIIKKSEYKIKEKLKTEFFNI